MGSVGASLASQDLPLGQRLFRLRAERSSFSLISSFTFFFGVARSFIIPRRQLSSANQRTAVLAQQRSAVRSCSPRCPAVPCRALPCGAVRCNAVRGCAVLCRAKCFGVLTLWCMYQTRYQLSPAAHDQLSSAAHRSAS